MGKLRKAESENISSTNQIIEPIINKVVRGTRIRPVIIPIGIITLKKKHVTAAVARNAPHEADNGCKRKSGALPDRSLIMGCPAIKIPASAR